MTDTEGHLLSMEVQPANIQDRDGADSVIARAIAKYPGLTKLYADQGYAGKAATRLAACFGLDVVIVRRSNDGNRRAWVGPQIPLFHVPQGFQIVPMRWRIERTNGWNLRPRRLAADHEQRIDVAEAWIWLHQAMLLLSRICGSDGGSVVGEMG